MGEKGQEEEAEKGEGELGEEEGKEKEGGAIFGPPFAPRGRARTPTSHHRARMPRSDVVPSLLVVAAMRARGVTTIFSPVTTNLA